MSALPSAVPHAVTASALTRTYGEGDSAVHALRGVSLDLPSGQFTAVMGPSGSGKSTLMHILAGLDRPTSGEVYIDGIALGSLNDKELTKLRRERIGFVFQSFNLLPVLDALENITLPMQLAGQRPDRAWLDAVIARLGLRERLGHRPHELSGGQQQRVAIARSLVNDPHVILGDEPTGNLDSRAGAEVLGLLRSSVKETGQTVVMVTHDPSAAAYADRVVLLADGALAGELIAPTAESVLDALRGLGA